MKTIAVIKPEMSVLDHRRLPLSPFGVLAQTFAEEVLARSSWEEGIWPSVPLALLEEEETETPPGPPSKVTLQMDLHLVLEALRRQGGETTREKTVERIVERVLERQSKRTGDRKAKEKISDEAGVPSLTILGTIHQNFQQHLTQALRVELGQEGAAQSHFPPGRLARQAETFSRRLQALREEGKPQGEEVPLAQGTGRVLREPGEKAQPSPLSTPQGAQRQHSPAAVLPPQALDYLQDQGEQAAQELLSAQTSALLRQEKRLERLLREETEEVRARDAEQRLPVQSPVERSHRMDEKGAADTTPDALRGGERQKDERSDAGTTRPTAPLEETGRMSPTARQTPTTARDIRVGPGVASGSESAPPTERGQMSPVHPPVELSHRTDGEETTEPTPGTLREGVAAKEETTGAGSAKPAAPLEEQGLVSPSARQTPTTARDIRVSPGAASGNESVLPTEVGQTLPVQPPVELSHRTDGEEAAEATLGTLREGVTQKEETTGAGRSKPAASLEERGSMSPAAQQTPTTARDIRMGPSTAWGNETAPSAEVGQALPVQPPVELSHRAEGEGTTEPTPATQRGGVTQKEEITGAGGSQPAASLEEKGPMSPMAHQTPTTARDIRVSPSAALGNETAPSAEVGQALPVQPPVELSHRAEGERATESIPGALREGVTEKEETTGAESSKPAASMEEKGHLSPTAHQTPTTARDIRVGPSAALGSESTPPTELGQTVPVQPPVELSHRADGEGTTEPTPATQRGGVARKEETTGAGETQPAASLEEKGPMSPVAHQTPTTARDIRVGPSAVLGNETAPSAEAGQMLPVQPPVELSHRTEGEGATEPTPATQRGGVVQNEETTGAGSNKPSVSLEEKGHLSSTAQQTPTTARDIRVGPSAAWGNETAPSAEAGQPLPVQPPVELSHWTDGEGTTEPTPATQRGGVAQNEETTGAGGIQPAASWEEKGPMSPVAHQTPTTARDIRVGPSAAWGNETAPSAEAGQTLPVQPPVELSHRTEGEGTIESTPGALRGEVARKEETAGAGSSKPAASLEEKGPMSPTAHQSPTTARDIRVGPSAAVPGREATSQATPGQSLSVQPPVELSHRTEGEGAEGAAAERKAAGGPTAPAVPLEEKEPSSRGPWQTPTSARDIRMGPTMASGEEAAAQAPAGQSLPVQAPVELSYRTDAEEPSPGAPRIEAGTKESRTGDGRRASSPRPEEPGQHRPTPQHAPTTARDIRVGPAAGLVAQNATASDAAQSPAGGQMLPPEMIFGTSGQTPAEGPMPSQRQTSPKVQTQRGQTAQSKAGQLPLAPLTLSYGPLPPPTSPPPQDPGTGAAQQAEESEYVRSLPDWARRFLKNGAPTQGNQTMGVARDIATLPPPVPEDTVQWTAPNYRPPEAPVTLREKSQPNKPSPAQEVRITEAEIQRTADRVYQMLEDRIRRERRRLGL